MLNRFFTLLFILCIFSFNVTAKNNNNPFAKNNSLNIGKDVSWNIDKKAMLATKTVADGSGFYYHLKFDNKQLEFLITSDASGTVPKKFSQLEVKNLKIDGKQVPLFSWCLNNQERHNRFLQQGLTVKKNICEINGDAGRFVVHLNRDTLTAIQKGDSLSIMLKPFRTPIELNYVISDFQEMYQALNAKDVPAAAPVTKAVIPATSAKPNTGVSDVNKCWARPPKKYKTIRAIEYACADVSAKLDAETGIIKQVNQKKANERELAAQRAAEKEKQAAEKEKQRKLAEDKRQKEQAAKLKQDELLQVEAAAVAASEAKQAEIGGEISQKMINMCEKYWSKGEHRCYCQKYIEHAPEEIQKNSSCK